jgi:hypothetical protein
MDRRSLLATLAVLPLPRVARGQEREVSYHNWRVKVADTIRAEEVGGRLRLTYPPAKDDDEILLFPPERLTGDFTARADALWKQIASERKVARPSTYQPELKMGVPGRFYGGETAAGVRVYLVAYRPRGYFNYALCVGTGLFSGTVPGTLQGQYRLLPDESAPAEPATVRRGADAVDRSYLERLPAPQRAAVLARCDALGARLSRAAFPAGWTVEWRRVIATRKPLRVRPLPVFGVEARLYPNPPDKPDQYAPATLTLLAHDTEELLGSPVYLWSDVCEAAWVDTGTPPTVEARAITPENRPFTVPVTQEEYLRLVRGDANAAVTSLDKTLKAIEGEDGARARQEFQRQRDDPKATPEQRARAIQLLKDLDERPATVRALREKAARVVAEWDAKIAALTPEERRAQARKYGKPLVRFNPACRDPKLPVTAVQFLNLRYEARLSSVAGERALFDECWKSVTGLPWAEELGK